MEKDNMKFEIINLSINQADCFLIILETNQNKRITILVDGNKENSDMSHIRNEIDQYGKLDFIVVTHVDDDHLGGIIQLLNDESNEVVKDTKIIYNHVVKKIISYKQAKQFEDIIKGREIINSYMNSYDSYEFMDILSMEDRKLCVDIGTEDRAFLTFINPKGTDISKVHNNCIKVLNDEKKRENSKLINRNSIVFMLEFNDKKALFTGDSTWKYIQKSLDTIFLEDEGYDMNLIKIPHHGAYDNNIELSDYAQKHNTEIFLVTGNQEWDKNHPSEKLISELKDKCIKTMINTFVKIPESNVVNDGRISL
jgi:beta-lactamase superfamily II metal-dependent hydrolase